MDDVSELIQDYLDFDDSVAQDDEDKTAVQEEQKTPSAAGVSKTRVANAITPLLQQEMMVMIKDTRETEPLILFLNNFVVKKIS